MRWNKQVLVILCFDSTCARDHLRCIRNKAKDIKFIVSCIIGQLYEVESM